MVILPLIVGGIAAAIITGLSDTSGIGARLADSHDAQITSAYFVRDVQTAAQVSTATGSSLCPTNGSASQLLGLSWTNGNTPVYVSYGVSTAATPPTLVRRFCQGTTESDSTVSHGLFNGLTMPVVTGTACPGTVSTCASSGPSTEATVTVNCLDGTKTCANSGLTSTFPISARGVPGVASIAIQVTDTQSNYQYNLSASPRDQDELASVLPPGSIAPAVLLLDPGAGVASCGGSGHGGPLTVNGTAAVDSTAAGSLSFAGGDTMVAGQVYSENPATSGASDPVQPPSAYRSTSAQPYASGPTYPDPYATLPDPSTTGLPVYATTNSLPGPGVYTNAVALTSSVAVAAGTYIFERGLSLSGNPGTTFSGSGVFFFIGVPNAPPGAPQPATYSVSGNAVVKLRAPTSGTYMGFVIFQSRYDSNSLTVSGNGTNTTYGGVIYAPDASVDTSGNGATFVGTIVSGALACGGNGGVSVGYAGVQTTPSSPQIGLGSSVTDGVAVIGNPDRGDPTGTVSFYVCGPTGTATPCTSQTTPVGASVALAAGANNVSTATSAPFTPTAPGTWCLAGYYSGDPNYGPSSDTSVTECFSVNGPEVAITFPVDGNSYTGKNNGSWNRSNACGATNGFCGTATEVGAGTITSVQFSLLQGTSGKCFDGTFTAGVANFTAACDHFLPATGTTAWSQPWPYTQFGTGGVYTLKVQVTDSNSLTATATAAFQFTP